ncbi:MAG: hypothetical protein CSA96_08520, partial [Bacteroidetes bacterium]
AQGRKIYVGPGPEDMVLDSTHGNPRLLLSCAARRDCYGDFNEIVALDLISEKPHVLPRMGEPDSLRFVPHGIFLKDDLLYVISHEREPDYHPILLYRVSDSALHFKERIHTSFQHSPNALCVNEKGQIYLVNDAGKRNSLLEKALKLKRASIVRIERRGEAGWEAEVVATGLGYPAGINLQQDLLFAGDAVLNRIHVYRINGDALQALPPILKLKGNDNLRMYGKQIILAAHSKPLRFVRHARNPDVASPVRVYLSDPETGRSEVLYDGDGSEISAGSTALIYRDKLYICQVFEDFILKQPL